MSSKLKSRILSGVLALALTLNSSVTVFAEKEEGVDMANRECIHLHEVDCYPFDQSAEDATESNSKRPTECEHICEEECVVPLLEADTITVGVDVNYPPTREGLQAAVDDVAEGGRVMIGTGISYNTREAVEVGKRVTIDLNGFTVEGRIILLDQSDLTIEDESGGRGMLWTRVNGRHTIESDSDFTQITVNSGKVVASGGFSAAINNRRSGSVVVNGGEVSAKGTGGSGIQNLADGSVEVLGGSISAVNCGESGSAIYNSTTGSITVDGGMVYSEGGGSGAIRNAGAGSVDVTDGTVASEGENALSIHNQGDGNSQIDGGIILGTVFDKAGNSGTIDFASGVLLGSAREGADFKNPFHAGSSEIEAMGWRMTAGDYTLEKDSFIPSDIDFEIPEDGVLRIGGGQTLTNEGTILCRGVLNYNEDYGTLRNRKEGKAIFSPVITFQMTDLENNRIESAQYGDTVILETTMRRNQTEEDLRNSRNVVENSVVFCYWKGGIRIDIDDEVVKYQGESVTTRHELLLEGPEWVPANTYSFFTTYSRVPVEGEDGVYIMDGSSEDYSFTVNPRTLNVDAIKATDRVFDGTTEVEITGDVSGILEGDEVFVTRSEIGRIADAGVGEGKRVELEAMGLGGADRDYYRLQQPELTVTISPKEMTRAAVNPIASQEYDGREKTPELTFTDPHIQKTDYTAVYTNNVQQGTAKVTVTPKGNYTGDSFTIEFSVTSGGGSKESSSSESGSEATPMTPNNNPPTMGEIKIVDKAETSGSATVILTDSQVAQAIKDAQSLANKNGMWEDGISVGVDAALEGELAVLSVVLPQEVQKRLVEAGVKGFFIKCSLGEIALDLEALKQLQLHAAADVTITIHGGGGSNLSAAGREIIGSRSMIRLQITGRDGTAITDLGTGSVLIAIPYTLRAEEKSGHLYGVRVNAAGEAEWLDHSSLNENRKSVIFRENRVTAANTYGVGDRTGIQDFGDIEGHWAKDDIDYAVARGLIEGTDAGVFSPDSAITRGALASALAKLSNADISPYQQSSFRPDLPVSREQMAVMMNQYSKAVDYNLPKVQMASAYADQADISGSAADAVKQMQMAGVIQSKEGNRLDPKSPATRAEAAAVLRRWMELRISNDTGSGWAMNDSGKWMFYENKKAVTGKKSINGTDYVFNPLGELSW